MAGTRLQIWKCCPGQMYHLYMKSFAGIGCGGWVASLECQMNAYPRRCFMVSSRKEIGEWDNQSSVTRIFASPLCRISLLILRTEKQQLLTDCCGKRKLVRRGMNKFSEDVVLGDQQRRERRLRAREQPPNNDFLCRYCGRIYAVKAIYIKTVLQTQASI